MDGGLIDSKKYPRSLHLPWSPGGTSDDKRMLDVSGLLNRPVVFTEKIDGSNITYSKGGVFARTHSGPPSHKSFSIAKVTHANIKHIIPENVSVFAEYCYAVHSIIYDGLPDYSLIFGVRDDRTNIWWGWDEVISMADALSLPTVPEIHRGMFHTEEALRKASEKFAKEPSVFGGPREGLVIRDIEYFHDDKFSTYLAKLVRKNHVQTDDHWTSLEIIPQKLSGK
jgi:hypothetical protein